MKLMIIWDIHHDQRHEVFSVFAEMGLEAYQNQAGPSVTTLGRWHDIMNGRGYWVVETDDAAALTSTLVAWNSACDFEIAVVHSDEEAYDMLGFMAEDDDD